VRILSWNVNGLRALLKKGLLDFFKKETFNILCLQETKLQEDQVPEEARTIPGFRSYWSFAAKKGYSGTAVYCDREPTAVITELPEKQFNGEGRMIALEFPDFWLLNVYFPNGQMGEERLAYKLGFYEALFKFADSLRAVKKNVVICGDYNTAHREIDLANPVQNSGNSGFLPEERAWLDRIVRTGYVDTFRHLHPEEVRYTWWTYRSNARERNIGWRIDYFFISSECLEKLRDAFILDQVIGSDHCPAGIEILL
jgi:exodeoxyribonuclease III